MRDRVIAIFFCELIFISLSPFVNPSTIESPISPTESLIDYFASLDSLIVENVDIHNDGTCNLTIEISTPTADSLNGLYRIALNLSHLDLTSQTSIPNQTSYSPSEPAPAADVTPLGWNSSGPVRNVRDETLASISQEQLCSLGINITSWTRDYVVEVGDELLIHLEAEAQLHANVPGGEWLIAIGPRDIAESKARASYVLTKFGTIQQLLESTSISESTYNSTWITTFLLPQGSDLTNAGELSARSWTTNFGNGNELSANLSCIDGPIRDQVILLEHMNVTMGSIDKTMWELLDQEGFLSYKIFNIHYSISSLGEGFAGQLSAGSSNVNEDWSKSWSIDLWEASFELEFQDQGVDVILDVYSKLRLSWYMGWDTEWGEVKWFKAWLKLDPQLNVTLTALFPGSSVQYEWSKDLFSWTHTFSFFIGFVPVWADLNFNAAVAIEGNVSVAVRIECGVETGGSWKAGIKWDDHFSLINDLSLDVNRTGPEYSLNVDDPAGWIRPSVTFSLEFMLYGIAGPYVDFTPYAYLRVWYAGKLFWWIKVGFSVTVGVKFAGWLEDALDLPTYERTLLDMVFWNDTSEGDFISDVAIIHHTILDEGWVNESVPVSFDVLNKGFNVEDVNVSLTCWEGTVWEHMVSASIESLEVGTTQTVNFNVTTFPTMPNDTYTIFAQASIQNTDNDLTDNTDSVSTYLQVQNVAVSSANIEKTSSGSGYYNVTMIVTVTNQGSVNVTALPVFVFYIKNHTNVPVSDVWCETLQWGFNMTPGDTREKRFSWIQPESEINTELDAYAGVLPHELNVLDNYWKGIYLECRHKTIVGQGQVLTLIVSGTNRIPYTVTFNLKIYANGMIILNETVTALDDESWAIYQIWNTTGWTKGNYTISAEFPILTHLWNEWVFISLTGDVNGDKKVDISDISSTILGYGALPSEPWQGYCNNLDVNSDQLVDITDIVLVISQFGKNW